VKRQANFEVLRVVAMAMIVAMHFMHKGGIIKPLYEDTTVVNYVAWIIESFCNVAANCYVLIAGYFLVDREWKFKKLVVVVLQAWFYSMLIPVLCFILGVCGVREWSIYEWVTAVLPLQMDHYWFATAYVLMFMLSPVLAAGVKQLSKKQLEITIGVLLVYFCVFKSISPILLSTDKYGYDYNWFICMFLIAAYIRLHGTEDGGLLIGNKKVFCSKKQSVVCYVATVAVICCLTAVLGMITARIGKFDYYMNMVYSYNHILTLIASLSLFFAFKYWQPKEGKLIQFLCKIAPYTFGVYLIHENIVIRNLWPGWFGVGRVQDSLLFVPYMLLVIVCVFAVCMTIDAVRKVVFDKILSFAQRK